MDIKINIKTMFLPTIIILCGLHVCLTNQEPNLSVTHMEDQYENITINHEEHSREKRQLPLMFPEGGTSKLLIGFAVPVNNPMMINLIFAINFQYQYAVPPNVTIFTQYYPFVELNDTTRKRRSLDYDERTILYTALEKTMDNIGVNGHSCLLRTICEAAETPVHHEGLIGELLHLIFTPPYHARNSYQNIDSTYEDTYLSARRAGEQFYDCRHLYPGCPVGHGIFDIISYLDGT